MDKKILDHYLKFSLFTNPGCYKDYLKTLPNDIKRIGSLVRKQIIHRVTLRNGNTLSNVGMKYGDMNKIPFWRLRCEDDVLPSAISMIAELFRLDKRGFVQDRDTENKIIVTCRYVSVLIASVLKSKGIPTRVRSGFASYFFKGNWDHWINQYWNSDEKRWITIDVDGSLEKLDFDPYNMPEEKFYFAANTWLGIREGRLDENNFINAGGFKGLMPVSWELFYDFHSLMNNELLYVQTPNYIWHKFNELKENDLKEIDRLAQLILDPDKNFYKLKEIWEREKKYRIISGGLIRDSDHVKYK